MRLRLPIMIFAALALLSCTKHTEVIPFDPPLIVEGWIESGRAPVVIVSSAIEATEEKRSVDNLPGSILRYAKVSIEHNGRTYGLSSRLSDEYSLKNYYTTRELRGEVGETYLLNVEWNGKKATAVTSIPEPPSIQALETESVGSGDSLFVIKAKIRNEDALARYYKFFTRVVNREAGYSPSFMGTFSNMNRPDPISYTVEKGLRLLEGHEFLYFHKADTVSVKLATMEEKLYRFWGEVDQNAMCTVFPAVTLNSNIPSNIEGGSGYWAGYGITEKTICIE